MTAHSHDLRSRLCIALLATAPLAGVTAGEDNWLDLTSTELPLELVQNGIDLTFVEEGHLLVLRPQDNAVSRVTWYNGSFEGYTKQSPWNWPQYVHYYEETGYGCSSYGNTGDVPWCHECPGPNASEFAFITVPVSDGLSIDFIAGDTVISHYNRDSMSIHAGSIGDYYYICGAPTGAGEATPVGDYDVGADGKAFRLEYSTGPGLVVNSVLGTTRTRQNKGAETREGSGSSGGGPYPGEDSAWTLADSTTLTSISSENATADFDGDGFEDLVVLHPEDRAFSILPFLELAPPPGPDTKSGAIFGDPISVVEGEGTLPVPELPLFAAADDFDGDGNADLAVLGSDARLCIYRGDGAFGLTLWTEFWMSSAVGGLEAADLDGDGRVELILAGGDPTSGVSTWTSIARVLADGSWDGYSVHLAGLNGQVIALDAETEAGSGEVAILVAEYESAPRITAWGDRSEDRCDVPPSIDATTITHIETSTFRTLVVADGELVHWGTDYPLPQLPPEPLDSIAAGGNHAIGLFQEDGRVVTWLGISGYEGQLTSVPPEIQDLDIYRIASGGDHGYLSSPDGFHAVITQDRNAIVWGLDDDPDDLQSVPVELQGSVEQLAGGASHIVARTVEGNVVSWGDPDNTVPDELTSMWRTETILGPTSGWHFLVLSPDGAMQGWGRSDIGTLDIPPNIAAGSPAVIHATTSASHTIALLEDDSVVAWGGSTDYGHYDVPAGLGALRLIEAGYNFTAAVAEDGSVHCWGINYGGQCDVPEGVGTPTNPAVQLAPGFVHTAALLSNGSVACWGLNFDLSGAYTGSCDVPADVGTPANPAIQVATGFYHTAALLADGSIRCWGANHDLNGNYVGQCDVPEGVGTPRNPAVQIKAGAFTTIALLADGTVVCWGSNDAGQCDVPPGLGEVSAVAAGIENTAALLADGSVVCWGDNNHGQLDIPVEIAHPLTAVQVSAGEFHSIVLLSDGTVRCFGRNSFDCCEVPPEIGADPDNPCVEVAAGEHFSVARMADGTITCWGNSFSGQCDVPSEAQGRAIAVSSSYDHSVALLDDRTVVCWGRNGYGQCDVPANIHDPTNPIVQVAANTAQTIALREDGTMVAWSYPIPPYKPPTPIRDIGGATAAIGADGVIYRWSGSREVPQNVGSPAVEIARGGHYIARYADDSIRCWDGSNTYGQLEVPDDLASGQKPVASIFASSYHSMVLLENGSVVCWGRNDKGQCDVPPEIQGDVIAIAAGALFSAAVKSDGTVRTWGETEFSSELEALTNISAIDSNTDYSESIIALEEDGTIHTFSIRGLGGQSDYSKSAPPTPIESTLVAAGRFFFVAVGRPSRISGHLIRAELDPIPRSPDINGDGIIDGLDLTILLRFWDSSGGPADLDGDGNVGPIDLAIILGEWGPYQGD